MCVRLSAVVWRWLALLLVLAPAKGATLTVMPGPFRSGKCYVACRFDGVRENCFLDTGAAMTLVRHELNAGPAVGRSHFQSASGKELQAEFIHIDSVELDRAQYQDLRIGRFPRNDGAFESSVGMDILGRAPFELAFHDSPELRVGPPRPRALFPTLRVAREGLMAIPLRCGSVESDALIDTGASVTAVDPEYVRAHPADFKKLEREMSGTDGTGQDVLVQLYRAKLFTIGGRTFRNIPVPPPTCNCCAAPIGISTARPRLGACANHSHEIID